MPRLRVVDETIRLLERRTGLKAEGRRIEYESGGKKFRCNVKDSAVWVEIYRKQGPQDKEMTWAQIGVIPFKSISTYLDEFERVGEIRQYNEVVDPPEKPRNKKAKSTEPKKKREGGKVSYGLGHIQIDKEEVKRRVSLINDKELTFAKAAAYLVLQKFDNESCIIVLEKLYPDKGTLKDNDINKARRVLRRKGLWE